jgi:Na+/proline symporter
MQLYSIDWVVILASVVICFGPALFLGRRASRDTSEFFASGRAVPWWLAGISMVATTFSTDTPNLVTDIVRRQGVAGNWVWWAFLLTGIATVFFYARMWRRSGVLTDLEFYEIRYSGRAAQAVRGFRAVYLGLLFNCMIMATVNLAACKIAAILFGLDRWQTLLAVGVINVIFAAHAGLWGVLVIDLIQFFLMMTAVIAAAYFAVNAPEVGGLHALVEKVSSLSGPGSLNYLNLLPDFTNNWELAIAVFLIPVTIQWWAVWYPGGEPGGGSYIAQRMLASRSERDALGAVLFFNFAHYVLRPWPWILVALASLVVYPELADIQRAFPDVDARLIGHDIAYPAMLKFLPAGFAGLMIGGFIAAYSSTMLTHLNWGASYLVHDFYRRFIHRDAGERHYVLAGRVATVVLFVCGAATVYLLDTAKDAFDVILQIGAGTGLLYLVRWFWWRVNAWCEIVAMVSSFVTSLVLLALSRNGMGLSTHAGLLTTVAITTVCWLVTAYAAPSTDRDALIRFYKLVRPAGPGWAPIRAAAGLPATGRVSPDNIPMALLGWVAGCTAIWTALFTVGSILYGRWTQTMILAVVFAVSASALIGIVAKLWQGASDERTPL